jgi:hypothetical protein
VFDVGLIEEMLERVGFGIADVTTTRTDFFALAVKTGAAATLPTQHALDVIGAP